MIFFFSLWLIAGHVHASEPDAQRLHLVSRESPALISIHLNDNQWRWLGLKRELKIATWAPENPPFDTIPDAGLYDGIYADYIRLITTNLGLGAKVFRFSSREKAVEALKSKQVDMMVDDSGGQPVNWEGLTESRSFMANLPVLVTREKEASRLVKKNSPMLLAVTKGYLSDQKILEYFPAARIIRFPTNDSGLACVVHHRCDYFFGNLTAAGFLIERNYGNVLAMTDVFPAEGGGNRFIVRSDDTVLKEAINTVLSSLPEALQKNISRQWVQRSDIWRFQKPLDLTEQEKRWIAHNPTVKVLINPFFAPFSMLDNSNAFHGISAELLRLIHLRTGIRFEPVSVNSALDIYEQLENKKGDMIVATRFDESHEPFALFSRPWLYTSAVLVVRNKPNAPVALTNNMTVAAVGSSKQALIDKFTKEWPGIKWIFTENAGTALELVNSGRADGALHTQLGASFMIDRYFRGKLKIITQLGDKPNQLGFAVRRDEPELQNILNKALADIQPQEISLIVHKWQYAPNYSVNTWKLYNEEFYWVLGGAGTVIVLILLWVHARNNEVKRRRLAQEELQEQLSFRDTLINGTPTPVYVLDSQMQVIACNEAYTNYFHHIPAEHLTYSLYDLRHPLAGLRQDLTKILLSNEEILQHGQTEEFSINNGSGARIIAHWSTPYSDSKGKTAGLICGWQDITDHKLLLEELSKEKVHAEEANKAKSAFLATMSHEIRTPISAILGLLELESSRQPDNEAIQISYTSAQTLLSLIGDVLDMARIESGQLELIPEWQPLDLLVSPVIKLFEEMARKKDLDLRYISQTETDLEIKLDGGRFRQIIANYLSNAVKFTQSGHVTLLIHSQKNDDATLTLHIEIEDSGPGISLSDQKKLFKPFVQLEAGRRQMGTGLGLVISSQLLEKMNGNMQMRSSPGKGTQILIELTVPVRPLRQQISYINELPAHTEQKLLILIVDDHPVNRMVLNRQLTILGHTVTEAASGKEALTYWMRNRFDVIITDCSMPDMDGFALTRTIREAGDTMAIFGLTADAQSETRAQAKAAGMNDCLFKPVRLSSLKAVLQKVMNIESIPHLDVHIRLNDLKEMLHNDNAMIAQLLSRIVEENEVDMRLCMECFSAGDREQLASILHRISGASQVICASEIDELAATIEQLVLQDDKDEVVKEYLNLLKSKLMSLKFAIRQYLRNGTDN